MDIRRPKTEPQEKCISLQRKIELRKGKDKRRWRTKLYHIRSAKSAPAIEFDVDEEADENPRPLG